MNSVRDGIIEVKLRSEFVALTGSRIGANFEVDVDGSARVPAGIYGEEAGAPVGAGHLIATQELLAAGIESPVEVADAGKPPPASCSTPS